MTINYHIELSPSLNVQYNSLFCFNVLCFNKMIMPDALQCFDVVLSAESH